MNEIILNGESMDIVADNIEKLKAIFPDVFTEGKVDFEKLGAVLGNYIEKDNERYNFTWHGKSQALRLAQTPSTGTLRPCKEESKDWDTTQNLYIEGDNLEVLKLLQKSYHNKVKMIYIDPPYNTGKDFVYPDNYKDNMQNYLEITGQVDREGNKIGTNSEASGRYHTNWLNMIYPRLKLARNLLEEQGVIFISIDDREMENLKKICNEIFGEENFVACVIWERAYSPVNLKKHFSESHDFILCYAKNIDMLECNGLERSSEANSRYKNPDNDPRGLWKSSDLSVGPIVEEKVYEITTPSGRKVLPPKGYCWRLTKERLEEYIEDNRIWFGEDGNNVPSIKRFLSEVKNTMTPMTIWKYSEVGHSQDAMKYLKEIFNDKAYFDYPKPVELINRMIELYTNKESIILDFFSGSSTTAEAVMRINAKDSGNRKFIMVQLQEETSQNSQAYKDGYINICEIAKERIRKVGNNIIAETKLNIDIGFKVLKLALSNIRKWSPNYDNIEQTLYDHINNFVEGRTALDVVFEIMLKYGIDLTMPIDEYELVGKKVYSIGFGALIICLDQEIDLEIAYEITKLRDELQPEVCRVVFRDNGFKNDTIKTNVKENLKVNHFDEIVSI